MIPLNAWYVAAWDHEVGRALLPRTICGRPVVLFRTISGIATALADACWHRLVPLSMGRLDRDDVVCGYHGIKYGPDGRCTSMPAQQTLNPSAAVAAFPVVERHRFVWIWPGDPGAADPTLIPDLRWNDDPEWAGDGGTIELSCDYRLVLDNLMDLTHEQFLHAGSLASDELSEAEPHVVHDDHSVTVTRWMTGIDAPAFLGMQLQRKNPAHRGPVDRWQMIRFSMPSTIAIDVGVAPAGTGAPQGRRDEGINGFVMNSVTPVTTGTSRYFWAFARNYHLSDQSLTTLLTANISRVFSQDTEMLNAQQIAIEANEGYDFYNLNIDAGGMWVRRVIDAQAAHERGVEPSHPGQLARVADLTRQAR